MNNIGVKEREKIEWTNYWWENAADETVKRWVIVGDSLARGFRKCLQDILPNNYVVDFVGTSSHIRDLLFEKEIHFFFESTSYQYELAILNFGGLHGHHIKTEYGTDSFRLYKEKYESILDYIRKEAKNVVIVSSTHIENINARGTIDEERNQEVKNRNKIIHKIAHSQGLLYVDLYSHMWEQKDEYAHIDHCHFVNEANCIMAQYIYTQISRANLIPLEQNAEKVQITFILPSLNVGPYIDQCLQSIRDQNMENIEILCIDGGSTDETISIINKHVIQDHRIKLFHSEMRSYGYQVNLGIKSAKGKYIAIVETDDFVCRNKYEKMYAIACEKKLDYIKADFKMYELEEQEWKFSKVVQFEDKSVYNRVIYPRYNLYLYINDINIWRGIYLREFLLSNQIFLNESSGAAFQDIGFVLRVLSNAKRGYYINESLYCYRVMRAFSSSSDNCSLRYVAQECKFFMENKKMYYERAAIVRFVKAFLEEMNKLASRSKNDYLQIVKDPDYIFLKNFVSTAIHEGKINSDDIPNESRSEVWDMLFDFKSYWDKKKKTDVSIQCYLDSEVVICGCGKRGKECYNELISKENNVVAFLDNNPEIWGDNINGVSIYNPDKCIDIFPEALYIIAIGKCPQQIKLQLLDMGVKRNNIKIY